MNNRELSSIIVSLHDAMKTVSSSKYDIEIKRVGLNADEEELSNVIVITAKIILHDKV